MRGPGHAALVYTAHMDQEERLFLRDFFRAVADRALEPDHRFYVPIYDDKRIAHDDPVELLARGIE